ncbi:MAG: hypothetical protein PHR24_02640 [Oscillospiraceae bacterium]|nr:hypothetical protein [Oscillospiraceae bacterium]MDD3833485.1 hypothetical protein [Oscillospiraceae bacterium]MDD4546176.1 hypothetical protein [Oscillospiraceae bacterium]
MEIKISRPAKVLIYMISVIIITLLSFYFVRSMNSAQTMEAAYFRSNSYMFVAASVLLGSGIYSYISYTRHNREHASDSLVLVLIGLALMITTVAAIIVFGGLETPFTQQGYNAVNINIISLSVLPIPFFIKGLVLSFGSGFEKNSTRKLAWISCGVAAVLIIIAFSLGGLFRLVEYRQEAINPPLDSYYL